MIFRNEFYKYSSHIVASWFLRATKLELLSEPTLRKHILVINSDFGENIMVISKHETADQFFHRLEICLFGSVCVISGSQNNTIKDYQVSYILTSDYK